MINVKYSKLIILVSLSFTLLIMVVIYYLLFIHSKNDFETVAFINGEPLEKVEYLPKFIAAKDEALTYFQSTYNADTYDKSFWQKDFNGETPTEYARRKALAECVRYKLQLILMKEKGLYDDINYSAFLKRYQQENKQKGSASGKKQIVYGPEKLEPEIYFSYVMNTGISKLKTLMDGKELIVTDKNIRDYYQKNTDNYKMKDTLNISIIKSPYVIDKSTCNEFRDKAEKEINFIKDEKAIWDDFSSVKKKLSLNVSKEDLVLKGEDYRSNRRLFPNLYPVMDSLKTGEISQVVEENGAFVIAKLIDRNKSGFISVEEEYTQIKRVLLDQAYSAYLDKLYIKANVEVNENVISKIEEVK